MHWYLWEMHRNITPNGKHSGTKNSAPNEINQTQEWQGSVPTKVKQIFNSNLYWFVYKSPLQCNAMCFHGYMLWLTGNFKVYLSQSTLKAKLLPVKKFACKLFWFPILEISISGKSNETLLTFKHQRSTDWQDVPFCQLPTYDVPSRKLSVLRWVCPD